METCKTSVSGSKLPVLAQKLSATSFSDELDNADWDYGAPLVTIKRLTNYIGG